MSNMLEMMGARITIRLTSKERAAAEKFARRKGLYRVSAVVRMALTEFLRAEGYIRDDDDETEAGGAANVRPVDNKERRE